MFYDIDFGFSKLVSTIIKSLESSINKIEFLQVKLVFVDN